MLHLISLDPRLLSKQSIYMAQRDVNTETKLSRRQRDTGVTHESRAGNHRRAGSEGTWNNVSFKVKGHTRRGRQRWKFELLEQRRCSIVNFSTGRSIAPECVHLKVVFTSQLINTRDSCRVKNHRSKCRLLHIRDRRQMSGVHVSVTGVWKTWWWIFVSLRWPAAPLSLFTCENKPGQVTAWWDSCFGRTTPTRDPTSGLRRKTDSTSNTGQHRQTIYDTAAGETLTAVNNITEEVRIKTLMRILMTARSFSSSTHTAALLFLCVKVTDAVRDEISLRRWSASGGSIRAVLLVNRTSVNG